MSTTLKRSIDSIEARDGQSLQRKRILQTIEPQVDLPGPSLAFDKAFDRRKNRSAQEIGLENVFDEREIPQQLDYTNKLSSLSQLPIVNEVAVETYSGTQKEVCYGMIHNARVKILETATLTAEVLGDYFVSNNGAIYPFNLVFEDKCFFLQSVSSERLAVLNEQTSSYLQDLSSLPFCQLKVYSDVKTWDALVDKKGSSDKNLMSSVDIILYGPKTIRHSLVKLLSPKRMQAEQTRGRIYLQHPCHQEPDTDYDNPHVFKPIGSNSAISFSLSESRSGTSTPMASSILDDISNEGETTQAQLRRNFATVLGSLTRSKHLRRIEADIKIKTSLLPHQEEALDFMSQRELGPIPDEYSLWAPRRVGEQNYYEHLIAGTKTSSLPIETGGGILADDMGLGKTLTVIATIIRTATSAKQFSKKDNEGLIPGDQDNSNWKLLSTRSTLVLAPSPLLLEGWIQEIKTHCDGSLNIHIYHGRGRETDPNVLANSDIILSTYHTVAAEVTETDSPLYKIFWFRIVLDEAHIIRSMKTKLFRAVSKLSAKLRWCLTGTPVQNKVEDLASLAAFIRVAGLDNLHDFRKHVVSPLLKNKGNGLENLRVLLDSICLRRTKRLLDLPGMNDTDRYLELSTAERMEYDTTQRDMIRAVKLHDSQARNTKGYFGIFQLQLQLRRLCNHGTFQKQSSQAANDDIPFDPEQAFAHLKERGRAKCAFCQNSVTGLNGIEEQRSGSFTVCGHLLCSGCIPHDEKALRRTGLETSLQCSLCQHKIEAGHILTDDDKEQDFEQKPANSSYFNADGTSSKISALLTDLQNNDSQGKSIVFSCWTRSLDLIAGFLRLHQIPFARIDGSCTLSQRQKILEEYEEDPSLRTLIMTTGTGAVGLNLTVANCVYISEPQWNPMVENQAIARVLRLGQKRDVKVVRYIMKGTVEESMRSQQTTKLEFAKAGWRDEQVSE